MSFDSGPRTSGPHPRPGRWITRISLTFLILGLLAPISVASPGASGSDASPETAEETAAEPEVPGDPVLPPALPGEPDDGGLVEAVDDIPVGDELLLFEDIPVVVAATRRAQRAERMSVALSVVTAEDIHLSGATRLSEILQFAPGMDWLALDRGTFGSQSVGVRGLTEVYSDRVLALVDGRNVNDPVLGGVFLGQLPYFLEDIERVEIVRGPAGALWGANAASGMINIVTKDPADTPGWLLSSTVTHFGDLACHLRWGAAAGTWSWRLSLGRESRVDSGDALEEDFEAHDSVIGFRGDLAIVHRPDPRETWSFGLAHLDDDSGSFFTIDDYSRTSVTRVFARVEARWGEGTSGHLQWYANRVDRNEGRFRTNDPGETSRPVHSLQATSLETDLEAQINFDAGAHEISLGGNVRRIWLDSENDEFIGRAFFFEGGLDDELWAGLFALDRIEVSERLTIEAQARIDTYSETHTDWAGRLSAILAADDADRHVLRVSAARAYRTPLAIIREAGVTNRRLDSPPFPPNTFGLEVEPSDGGLDNESTWALETGYQGRLSDRVILRADVYYQRYAELIGFEQLEDPFGVGRLLLRIEQQEGAESYGGEVELSIRREAWQASAWYAYNEFRPEESDQTLRAILPALHKVGVTGRLRLGDDWIANLAYRYGSRTDGSYRGFVGSGERKPDARHRLDLSVAGRPFGEAFEICAGVTDVLNRTYPDVDSASLVNHELPGRTFFVRIQFEF